MKTLQRLRCPECGLIKPKSSKAIGKYTIYETPYKYILNCTNCGHRFEIKKGDLNGRKKKLEID